MKKYINGKYIEMTDQEIAAMKAEQAAFEAAERTRPLTLEEVSRMLITQQINSLTVDDSTALRMAEFYPEWKDLIGTTVDKAGFKFTHNGQLYKTIPEQHSFQADWVPGVGTESIYTRIDDTHAGTLADPIPAKTNMLYEKGKYYIEDGTIYLCTRDDSIDGTGTILQYLPSALISLYFEAIS